VRHFRSVYWKANRGVLMNPLDALIRQYVGPVAKASGFSKSGRIFRLVADNGDQALLGFSTHAVDPSMVVFDVNFFMVPVPYWGWITRQHPTETRAPDSSGALVTCRVMPPPQAAHRPDEKGSFRSRWAFDAEGSGEVCGRALGQTLRDETFPRMRHWLDRANLLDAVRSSDVPMMRRMDPLMREIVLRIDDAPGKDVNELLAAAEAANVLNAFVVWARQRLASRVKTEG
jgi:hypothetical protein